MSTSPPSATNSPVSADSEGTEDSKLFSAALGGDAKEVEMLLKAKANPEAQHTEVRALFRVYSRH